MEHTLRIRHGRSGKAMLFYTNVIKSAYEKVNPSHAEYIKTLRLLLNVSQSDALIEIFEINS